MQQHCDPDVLALRAIGESVGTDEEMKHLDECSECASELAALVRITTTAREEGSTMKLESPSPLVWQRISAELGLRTAEPSHAVLNDDVEAAHVPDDVSSLTVGADASEHGKSGSVGDAASAGSTRGPRTWLLALAAGVTGIAVGGIAVSVVADDDSGQPEVVASVGLEPLPDWSGSSGQAQVVTSDSGAQSLIVSVSGADAQDGYQEVWLIDSDVDGMISLGVLEGDEGEFLIPDGVDVGDFPVVDVSLEPVDGEPTHSGNSIVRGILEV